MTQLNTGEPKMTDQIPPWVEFVRGDIKDFRAEVNSRLDKFVTEETLNLRIESVQARIDGHGAELATERTERLKGDRTAMEALEKYQLAQAAMVDAQKSAKRWTVGTLITAAVTLIGALIASGVIK